MKKYFYNILLINGLINSLIKAFDSVELFKASTRGLKDAKSLDFSSK